METLEKLFGSSARVKILRLFLMNNEEVIDKKDVGQRAKVSSANVALELNMLEKIGLIKTKSFFKESKHEDGKIKKIRKKGYVVDSTHKLFVALQSLLVKNSPVSPESLINKINKHGKIKLVVVSGIFIQDPDSRVDLLIVGDFIKEKPMRNAISVMESEVGKQIRYAIFETADFKYRIGVYDRLVRDILDYPHQIILDKMSL